MAKKVTVKDTDKGFKALQTALVMEDKKVVDVGYFAGEIFEDDNDVDVALVARFNEFGTVYIPERSFMRSTYDQNKEQILREYRKYFQAETRALTFKALAKLGALVTSLIKKKIKDAKNWAVPNAPATIAKKTRDGKAGDAPLFDTGTLFNSIDFRESKK